MNIYYIFLLLNTFLKLPGRKNHVIIYLLETTIEKRKYQKSIPHQSETTRSISGGSSPQVKLAKITTPGFFAVILFKILNYKIFQC